MLGTGELAASASESTMPSWISSSCTVGTYCRQIGSPGDLIRSTMAGEMRNSKFSAAWRRRAMSPTCSGPNRAASASSDAMLFLRRSTCQLSIGLVLGREIFGVNHQIITGRVVGRDSCGSGEAAFLVKGPCGRVVAARARLNHHEPLAVGPETVLDLHEQLGPDAGALPALIDHDPIQVVRAGGPRCGPPARVAHQALMLKGADKSIVVVAGEAFLEQLDRGGDLFLAEAARRPRQLLKSGAMRAPDGAQQAVHGRPWRLAPRAAPPRRCAVRAPDSPSRRPSPCATGPLRRSGPGWG